MRKPKPTNGQTTGQAGGAARVIAALREGGWSLVRSGSGYRARCPAHRGKDRNLAVRVDGDTVLTKCHSHGCAHLDVLGALGLRRERREHRRARRAESSLTERIGREAHLVHPGDPAHRYLIERRRAWHADAPLPSSVRTWWNQGHPHVVFRFHGEDGESWQYERLTADGERLEPRMRRAAGGVAGKRFTVRMPDATREAWTEGPLTAMAAAQLYKCTAHAAGGATNLARVRLPAGTRHIIDADGDLAGWSAAESIRASNPYANVQIVTRTWGDALDELIAEHEERLALRAGY